MTIARLQNLILSINTRIQIRPQLLRSTLRSSTTTPKSQKSWSFSQPLTLNKSKFKGWCIPIESETEIRELLDQLPQLDKNLEKASHPFMLAWKIGTNPNPPPAPLGKKYKSHNKPSSSAKKITGAVDSSAMVKKIVNANQGSNDNGEGGSGARLLGLLDRLKLFNVLVIVSRWYGGTPLGPARFKCISDVAMDSLKVGGYLNRDGNGCWTDVNRVHSAK